MPDRTAVAFSASARALRELILPALDPVDATAREQATVIADLLEFASARSSLEHARLCFELDCYRDMASAIASVQPFGQAAEKLSTIVPSVTESSSAPTGYAQLQSLLDELRCTVSSVLTACVNQPEDAVVRRAVVIHTMRIIEMQRSWFSTQGFDPDPGGLLPIDVYLSQGADRTPDHPHPQEQHDAAQTC